MECEEAQESDEDAQELGGDDADSEGDDADSESLDGELEAEDGNQHGESENLSEEVETRTGGTMLRMYYDEERDDLATFRILGRSKHRSAVWPTELCEFMNHLQDKVIDHIPWKELQVFTEHHRDDVKWHAHPNYRGNGIWTDWALVDWGREGVVPCRIWCFVDLRRMPIGAKKISHGGIQLNDGVFAVVECSDYSQEMEEVVQSDLFIPLTLKLADNDIQKGESPTRQPLRVLAA